MLFRTPSWIVDVPPERVEGQEEKKGSIGGRAEKWERDEKKRKGKTERDE